MRFYAKLVARCYLDGMNLVTGYPGLFFRNRTSVTQWLDAGMARAAMLSRPRAWAMTAALVAAAWLLDLVTGPHVWVGPVYLLIICLPAWSLGVWAGIFVGFTCMAASVSVNGAVYPLGHVAIVANMAMRILAVAIIVTLVGSGRRSYDREWRRARYDPLTGALNRSAFYEQGAAAHDRLAWAILAYVDLDGFKQINDRHGHAAGDATLRTFAENVRKAIREKDIFARIGGDEFLLHLPVGSETEGYRLARQLHERMNEILGCMDYPIRCSMGVLVLSPRPTSFSEADVHLADQLMYQAKREGAALRAATMTALCNHEGLIAFSHEADESVEPSRSLAH